MYPYEAPPRRQGTPVWVWILSGCGALGCIGFCVLIYGVYFMGKTVVDAISQMTSDMQASSAFLKVQDRKLVTYQGKQYVVGTVKNTSRTTSYDSVTVAFSIFDSVGNHVDEVEAIDEQALKPGETWRFRAPVISTAATQIGPGQATGFKTVDDSNLDPETKAARDKIIADTKAKMEKDVDDMKKREGGK